MTTGNRRRNRTSRCGRLSRFALLALLWIIAGGLTAWAFGALHFDFPVFGGAVAWIFLVGVVVALVLIRGVWKKLATLLGAFALVLAWWLTQQPRLDRDWQADVARLPWAEISGDEVTLHNIRNYDYRTETDFTPRWETRTVRLSQLTGIDIFLNYWGSPYMAHPIISFRFADSPPVCFSIETRKELGESYSAIGGLYRQYELICIAADERDVIRLRTNYRKGEESFLYRSLISPDEARERFTEYVATLNSLHQRPRWYNAVTANCTTAIRSQHPSSKRLPWDWRLLVNGMADEMLYERQAIATDGLSFADLRQRALVNAAAQAADKSPDFSRLVRAGRPGFAAPSSSGRQPGR